ncbi:hypothetical protein ABVK25_006009 [Lepraria finkii]|uniref:Uncharacterized protein n=1 Tax=Lepraria finkii TaxID=1340010 RepID=A0ABR4B772_9LECA
MLSLVLTSGAATLIRRGAPVRPSLEAVVNRIPVDSKVDVDEQIDDSTVHVDGELGVAWMLYVVYEDGRLRTRTSSTCGR